VFSGGVLEEFFVFVQDKFNCICYFVLVTAVGKKLKVLVKYHYNETQTE